MGERGRGGRRDHRPVLLEIEDLAPGPCAVAAVLRLPAVSAAAQEPLWTGDHPPADWLVQVNRHALVTRLLSTTVHDVNNMLQVVSGAAEVLAMDPTPEAVARRTASIVGQAGQATAALQALSAFARDSGRASTTVPVKALVEQAVGLRLYALRKGRVAVAVSGDEAAAHGSPSRVLQVLLNLLVNAEQALAGRTGATLTARVDVSTARVIVTVADNGPGVPEEQAASLFAWPPRPRGPDGALGLGLIVSRDLAVREGGTLTCTRGAEGGAAFELSLLRA